MMEGFVEVSGGWLLAIQGHVLIVRAKSIDGLHRFLADHKVQMPWAFSDEDEHFQMSHPLTAEEREKFAWLYHRMEALKKPVDNEDPEPDNDGPRAA